MTSNTETAFSAELAEFLVQLKALKPEGAWRLDETGMIRGLCENPPFRTKREGIDLVLERCVADFLAWRVIAATAQNRTDASEFDGDYREALLQCCGLGSAVSQDSSRKRASFTPATGRAAGAAGRGLAKRRAVDYSVLAKKSVEARRKKRNPSS